MAGAEARSKHDRKEWLDLGGRAAALTQTVLLHAPLALRPCAKVSQDMAGI